jgi:hypothetical protein
MLTVFKYQISNPKPQIISKLQFSNDLNDFVWEVGFLVIGNCLGFGIWCLVLTSERLAGFTRWDLFDKFFLLCWGQFLFDLPIFLGKRVLSLDEKPIFTTSSPLH